MDVTGTENLTVSNAPKASAKRKRGRQPGTPSPKSYYTPPKGAKPAELRAWMLQQSDALETLVRMARGRPYKAYGPTGKSITRETTAERQLWAIDKVLRRCMPELSGIQLSGDKDAPVVTQHLDAPLGRDKELARRYRSEAP